MSPFELVATPAASPMWTSVGELQQIRVRVERHLRNRQLGGEHGGRRRRSDSRHQKARQRLLHGRPLISPRDVGGCGAFEDDLLRAPGRDLGHEELVRIAAVDLVDGAELSESLAGLAELADDRAVELHLVDLAGDRPRRGRVAVRVGVRDEQVLVRPRRDADRPRVADVVVDGPQHQVVVEHLHARVAAIGDVDVALRVGRDRVRRVHLARRRSAGAADRP